MAQPQFAAYAAQLQAARCEALAQQGEGPPLILPPGFENRHPPGPRVSRQQALQLRPPRYLDDPYYPVAEGRRMQRQAEQAVRAARELIMSAVRRGDLPFVSPGRLAIFDTLEVVGDPNNMRFGFASDVSSAGVYGAPEHVVELSLAAADDDEATELAVHELFHVLAGADLSIGLNGLDDTRNGLSITVVRATGSQSLITGAGHWLNEAKTDRLTLRVAYELSQRVDRRRGRPRFYHRELTAWDKLTELSSVPFETETDELYFAESSWDECLRRQAGLFDRAFEPGFLAYLSQYETDDALAFMNSI